MKNNILAIIPARAGSKGIPGKNLKELFGIPLLSWAIRVAKKSHLIDHIVVTTDGNDIADCAMKENVSVIFRPKELADDKCPTIPVLQHALDEVHNNSSIRYNVVVLLEPTSPFRSSKVIDSCVRKLLKNAYLSVATVVQLERNPHNIFITDNNLSEDTEIKRLIEPQEGKGFTQRQQMHNLKRINGCVYVTYSEIIQKSGEILSYPIGLIEMTQDESVNIDSLTDFKLAEVLAENFQKNIL